MEKITGNEPAYPIKEHLQSDAAGLTKREYFAAMAMQGLCAKEGWAERMVTEESKGLVNQLAEASIKLSDALIESLNSKPQ